MKIYKYYQVATLLLMVWGKNRHITMTVRAEEECTHGKLFLSDSANPTLHVIDLDEDIMNKVSMASLDSLPLQGKAPFYLDQVMDGLVVTAAYWGSQDLYMADGFLNFIHTGVSKESHGDHSHLQRGDPLWPGLPSRFQQWGNRGTM